jgi:peptide/nickel transport system permease protein
MYNRILKRILLFYPTLFVLSVLLFILKEAATGDEVNSLCGDNLEFQDKLYKDCVRTYKLDRPSFYFSIGPSFYRAEALVEIFPKGRRKTLEKMLYTCGDWSRVRQFDLDLLKLFEDTEALNEDQRIELKNLRNEYFKGLNLPAVQQLVFNLSDVFPNSKLLPIESQLKDISAVVPNLIDYRPTFEFHGLDNRFHNWWSSAVVFEFGQSFKGRPVNSLIKGGIGYTIALNIISFLLGISLALLAVVFVSRRNERFQNKIDSLSISFLAIPRFWLATLLIFFFANKFLFPGISIFKLGTADLSGGLSEIFQYLSLPIFCLTFPIVIVIYKHLRENIVLETYKQYVEAARAMGLEERKIFISYILPNAINPLLTIVGSLFSRLLVGSVVIESIFFIPGLGGLLFDAFMSNDWPVLYALCFISGLMTLIGYLISDVLYILFDPKLRLGGLDDA